MPAVDGVEGGEEYEAPGVAGGTGFVLRMLVRGVVTPERVCFVLLRLIPFVVQPCRAALIQ